MSVPIKDWHGNLHPDLKGQFEIQSQTNFEKPHCEVSQKSEVDNTNEIYKFQNLVCSS